MLSLDEQSQLQIAISTLTDRASKALAKAQDTCQAVAFIGTLHRNTDTVITASDSAGPTPECKPGCTYCCSARVEVSDPEALYIARHIRQMPEEEKLPLLERLRLQSAGAGITGEHPHLQPCSFLRDGLCSIYSIRPSVCRKAHSLSVQACETRADFIPQNLTRVVQCEALTTGINKAFQGLGLPASRHELSVAVLAALAENAEETWYQGKPLLSDPSGNR